MGKAAWRWIVRHVREEKSRTAFLLFKYGIFNLVYIPIVVIFRREMLFAKAVSTPILVGVMIAGRMEYLSMIRHMIMFRFAFGERCAEE